MPKKQVLTIQARKMVYDVNCFIKKETEEIVDTLKQVQNAVTDASTTLQTKMNMNIHNLQQITNRIANVVDKCMLSEIINKLDHIRSDAVIAIKTNKHKLQGIINNLNQGQKRTALATDTSVATVRRISTQIDNPELMALLRIPGEKRPKAKSVDKSNELHEGFYCNSCSGNIIGYRYTCVQCANYDLCDSCEARGEHSHHYVLRIPKPAPFAEINAVLSKIRTQLLYGLDNDAIVDREEETDPQPCMSEETIKVEVKEELPDPLEHEDAFTTDDNYIETDTTELSARNTTAIVPNVKKSTMTLTESGGNLFIIENPISVAQTVPTILKKHKTTSDTPQVTKRIKVEPQETEVTCEFTEVPINISAASSTEGGSGELLRQVLTTKKPDEEASFQVFSHTEKNPVEAVPGPAKIAAGKKTTAAATKKKKSDTDTLNK